MQRAMSTEILIWKQIAIMCLTRLLFFYFILLYVILFPFIPDLNFHSFLTHW